MIDLKELSLRIHSVSVMRDLLSDRVIKALVNYLDTFKNASDIQTIDAYSGFVNALYLTGTENLSRYIQKIVNESENVYVKKKGASIAPSNVLTQSLCYDLQTFAVIASLTPEDLLQGKAFMPEWITENVNIEKDYLKRADSIEKYGFGIYAKYRMFYINEKNAITPVQNPDSIKLCDLIDYEREQKIIMDNTKALLASKPASNILLTGDAGTGKSSTIKAVVNELYNDGLRIIEVRKEQLHSLRVILDELSENPLKFILFIDDLSFAKDDDNFSALKALLEGSVSSKSNNVVIYATSNRRHLVKEKFSDREGDDVHFNDTLQEILSLSERFGIQLTFRRPDKATYLDIVHNLAKKCGIEYNKEKIDLAAERYALKRGIRSNRAAKQFVDMLISGSGDEVI